MIDSVTTDYFGRDDAMSETITVQIITAVTALLSVLVGGFATYMGTKHIEQMKLDNETRSLRAGFLSEIKSLTTVIRERRYLEALELLLNNEAISREEHVASLQIRISDDYAIFYKTNVGKVGLLDSSTAEKIILFHQLIQALVQDFHPESFHYKNGFSYEDIKEDIRILKQALDTASNIK